MKRSSGLLWVAVVSACVLGGCSWLPWVDEEDEDVVDTVQVRLVQPEGAKVRVEMLVKGDDDEDQKVWSGLVDIPGHMDLPGGHQFNVRFSQLPGQPGVVLQGRLTVEPMMEYTVDCAVPLELTRDDVADAKRDVLVVKVVYLPDKEYQHYPLPGTPASIVSTRLDPGVDAVEEAKKRGKVLLVLRLGGRKPAAP